MVGAKKSNWWQAKSWFEIVEHAKSIDLAILPVGSIEQHGPHLPTGDDTYEIFGICEGVAERTKAILLPCAWYGSHPYHHLNFPGTIPLTSNTYVTMIREIVDGASKAGYNKFILLNGHGQEYSTAYAAQEVGKDGHFCIHVTWWEICKDIINDTLETTPPRGFSHADECETSMGLHLFPQYVDMSKAEKELPEPLIDRKFYTGPAGYDVKELHWYDGTFARMEYKELKKGIIGDPTKATKEKGEAITKVAVERVSELIEDIMERWPAGEKPPVD